MKRLILPIVFFLFAIGTFLFGFVFKQAVFAQQNTRVIVDVGTPTGGNSINIPGLTIRKTGEGGCIDCKVVNGQNLTYTIKGSYSGTAEITIKDTIPAGTSFLSATGSFTNEAGAVSWPLSKNLSGRDFSFELALKPNQDNIYVVNQIEPIITSQSSPNPSANPRLDLIALFGITMNGFSKQHLDWALEIFNTISKTNFKNLTTGTTITIRADPNGYSEQIGCRAFYLHPHPEKIKFQLTILHELGHIIYWCNTDKGLWQNNLENPLEEIKAIYNAEGGLTTYSRNPTCIGLPVSDSRKYEEDFPEMIAYYLMPRENERDIKGCPPKSGPPYQAGSFPLHFQFALKILGTFP